MKASAGSTPAATQTGAGEMSVAWELYESAQNRALKYAGMFGQATGTARVAIMELQDGDVEHAIARLQKFLDDAEAAFPPITLEKAA